MAANPLQQYFRQPKIYVSLPSRGIFNAPGTINGDPNQLAVCAMTGMDEVIIKTPDALFTGEASVKLIESCCPNIKNAWDLSILDTELMFVAIRIATYGNNITIANTCGECNTPNEYELNLNVIVEHFSNCQYDNTVALKDLTVSLKPLTYKQQTDYNLQIYELQKQVRQATDITDTAEQQATLNKLWEELAQIQLSLNINSIDSVQTPDVTVNERAHISEWLANCESETSIKIKNAIDANRANWAIPQYSVTCTNPECKHETKLSIDLDNSNFFASA
jgi:hypothetical protein